MMRRNRRIVEAARAWVRAERTDVLIGVAKKRGAPIPDMAAIQAKFRAEDELRRAVEGDPPARFPTEETQ